ncbi:MAG: PBP1A family penicillin-binding protein [Betaproteobacteria bacterium]
MPDRAHDARLRIKLPPVWRARWFRIAAAVAAVPLVVLCFALGYYYVSFAHLIDARLHGERDRVFPRVFARPLRIRQGQSLTDEQLVDQLNDLGYAERPHAAAPGEFAVGDGSVVIRPRAAELKGELVRVVFRPPTPAVRRASRRVRAPAADHVRRLLLGSRPSAALTLDSPILASIISGEREKRRPVALAAIPPQMVHAVLAIEDRRFYEHPGVDPIRMVGALFSNLRGNRTYLSGASTITQQLVRNVFMPRMFPGMTLQAAREKSIRRKLLEQFLAVILDGRASKDEILELYLNDIPLGQRGSFAVYGVAEASKLFFGKDVSNVSLAEAATIAGVIQSPSALSPFGNPARCRERRDVVLQAMADAGYVTQAEADRAAREPLTVVQRALDAEAPYFVDYVGQRLNDEYPGLTTTTNQAVNVYTTLDLHLQRLAEDAVHAGLARVDKLLSHRRRKGQAQAVLIAIDPKTGEILAFVGGRSYNQSQYDRAIYSHRQPGSVFKPFVYLAAFEEAAAAGRTDVTPASIVDDEPTTFEFENQVWQPENYENEYDGLITFRHALAHSRNVGTIKVAQATGFDRVAAFWKRLGVGAPLKPYPSITLGAFEETPFDIATAYTIFPDNGILRPLRPILRITSGGKDVTRKPADDPRAVARPETTFLVTNMMRSVLNEGTAASARALGFTLDAAGKTGTTNDLRDAWFVGFTPDLLTVVWVGFDDNQPVGLSGSQAALPIWTDFMKRALAGDADTPFDVPPGVTFVDIDPDTGKLAVPGCPRVFREAFLAGTEPVQACDLHRY